MSFYGGEQFDVGQVESGKDIEIPSEISGLDVLSFVSLAIVIALIIWRYRIKK